MSSAPSTFCSVPLGTTTMSAPRRCCVSRRLSSAPRAISVVARERAATRIAQTTMTPLRKALPEMSLRASRVRFI
jgi:hypothetical protein